MARADSAQTERINPVCERCAQFMLAGMPPMEPAWFCPDHPDAQPVAIVDCECCSGKGWRRA